jgi:hypothetical protein
MLSIALGTAGQTVITTFEMTPAAMITKPCFGRPK